MDINKIHGEIWYQVAYTIGLLEQGNKLSKEDIKDVSDKIYDILSSQLEPPVVQKIAKLVEIQTNPDTSFLFSHVRTNKEVPDDEIWVSYKNGKLQKFKLL